MSEKIVYLCDVCGAERKEANHWFVGYVRPSDIIFAPFAAWDKGDEGDIRHLCGQACAHKLLDEFMSRSNVGPDQAATPPA